MAETIGFTPDQQKVIDLRNCSILVSAAAGSGKTAVLVERIIRLITDREDPVDVDRLLIVTFTRAAAAQMKDKINRAILDRLDQDPGDANLQRQAALIHNAHISTIDSFCQFIINNSVTDSDVEPGVRIADEAENRLLETDVLESLLEQLYTEADEDFLRMSEHFVTDSDDSILSEVITTLYRKAMSAPWPKLWLTSHADDYSISDAKLPAVQQSWMEEKIREQLVRARDAYARAYQESLSAGLCRENTGMIETEWEVCKRACEAVQGEEFDYDEIRDILLEVSFPTFSRKSGEAEDPVGRKIAKSYRDRGKELLKELKEEWVSYSYVNLLSHIKACEDTVRTLTGIVSRYIDELTRTKKEKKIMSFADCEHRALDVLVRPDAQGRPVSTDAAEAFRRYFKYVFIDEYQDSNLIQEYILSAVSGEEDGIYNRFMVGDVKQSIYRFRQAEPRIFTSKYEEYGYDDPHRCKVDLNMNFRSRREVLSSVNSLFERVMNDEEGGCAYDEAASLKCGASYPEVPDRDYTTELIFVDTGSLQDDSEEEEEPVPAVRTDRAHIEGEAIAERIRRLVDEPMYVRDESALEGARPVRYSDIVILYRASSEYANAYKQVLEERGIPAHLSGATGYFATYEIQTLINLLKVIDNPLQDIYFYGVMEGIFGGFSPEEIASVSMEYRGSLPEGLPLEDGYLYHACRHGSQDPDLNVKLKAFTERIDFYRELSGYLTVEELLDHILEDTGYIPLISAMKGGDRREANVEMLRQKAAEYGQTSYFGLYNFLRYIDNMKKSESFDAEAEMNSRDANVVHIMTEHKSKGLEFPVCIVARLGNEMNLSDAKGKLIVDYDAGIGIKDFDISSRLIYNNIMYKYVADTVTSKSVSEEMRILYVAMTRAKEKLILVCAGAGKCDGEDGEYVLKRSGGKKKYINWYLDCICDEFEADEFTVDHNFRYLPSMHVTMGLSDISTEGLKETDEAGIIDHDLRFRFLRDRWENLSRDDVYLNYLDRLYDRSYPHPDLKGLYSKTSVSELKASAMIEDEEAVFEMFEKRRSIPRFISGRTDRAGATVRGSAFHRIMELFDFGVMSTSNLTELLDRYLEEHRINPYEREIFDDEEELKRLKVFLESDTARRMGASALHGSLKKEDPFMMGISASELDERYPETETVLIQGIIDAWWMEDDGAVILDYKTDRVREPERLVQLYRKQLELYERALNLMHIRVKEKIIYSFELGITIPFS